MNRENNSCTYQINKIELLYKLHMLETQDYSGFVHTCGGMYEIRGGPKVNFNNEG